ncbi:MAG: hypothetical protein IJO73_09195 [Clostridia bacterium]|nr:hypothetical protein [Clostridia bacterium]
MDILKKLSAALLSAVLLLSLSACGRSVPASHTVRREESGLAVSADTDNKALYSSKSKNKLRRIAKSDMIELYFDSETCTVSVFDTASGELWSSLPEKAGSEKTSAVALTVLIKGNRYTLSSQSDSVGFSSTLYEERENGVTVNYGFKRTLEDGTKINLFLPVSYTLTDGALAVEADCSKLYGENHDGDAVVTDIDILPFFGSDTKGEEGDYILLPDGCGATVDISENPEKFESISLPVYQQGVLLGAFGMKKGDSAFAVLIDEGEELSCIRALKALSSGGFNRVYGSFAVTPAEDAEDRAYVCNEGYTGKLRLIYRFLSYDSANYTGMAGAVRELLIRNGYLLTVKDGEKGDYPFNLSVVFQNYVTDAKGKVRSQTLTTYSQAQEILDSLKAKGIGNVNLRMRGVLTPSAVTEAEYSAEPGKRSELDALLAYGGNGVSFYTDAALTSAYKAEDTSFAALKPDGEPVTDGDRAYISVDRIAESTNSLLSLMRESGVQGVCINDAGAFLYGDCTDGAFRLKTDTADIISGQTGAVSASGRLMLDTGNMYAVKYADVIVNVPASASVDGRELCTAVPFVQAILHSIADYSCEPVNGSKNSEKAFLKCIEYGAVPYYEWYAADLSSQEKTDKFSYLNSITEAQSQYERAAKAFGDLRYARITDHYRVKKNVYYTCYDNSTGIYVNYGSKPVSVNGVTVEAMSFLRVN